MARNLIAALECAFSRPVTLASRFRSFEPEGTISAQAGLIAAAAREVDRILQDGTRPVLWVTYHNYYKAPDLIGPAVSAELKIPYVLIEATRARSRLSGPWARFATSAEAASDYARVIFHFTGIDLIALARDRQPKQQVVELPPFLSRQTLPPSSLQTGPMLAVGMMRHKDKLASYALIAATLAELDGLDWQLDVVGDGDARTNVEELFSPFGDRVRFLGARSPEDLEEIYARSGLFIWPGVNEAFGMVYLEAQAAGLPVVAQLRPGVEDVLAPGVYPNPDAGAKGLAEMAKTLLADEPIRRMRGQAARDRIQQRHLLPAAADTLRRTLSPLLAEARA